MKTRSELKREYVFVETITGAAQAFDRLAEDAPTFHLSPMQWAECLDTSMEPFRNVPQIDLNPPFPTMRIVLDDHASHNGWFEDHEAKIVAGGFGEDDWGWRIKPKGIILYTSSFAREPTTKMEVIGLRAYQETPDADRDDRWVVMTRCVLQFAEEKTASYDLTVTTLFDPKTLDLTLLRDERYYLKTLKQNGQGDKCITAIGVNNAIGTIAFCVLLNSRGVKFNEYLPAAGMNRAERRAWQREHSGIGRRYAIHIPATRTIGSLITEVREPRGPKAFQEKVRGHKRTYKSGRVKWINAHTRGNAKPPRPGTPEYDAWALVQGIR